MIPESDPEYSWIWHRTHWGPKDMAGSGGVTSTAYSGQVDTPAANIIKYQQADWLYGLKDRKLPKCLIPWPLVRVDA